MAELHLTEGHNGTTVSATVGDTITLTLPENPTTGFRWMPVESASALLSPLSDEFTPSAPDRPGAAGMRSFRYTASSQGRSTLALQLVRPWAPDAPRARFQVDISVTR